MKKLASNFSVIIFILSLAFSFGSCESEYECTCSTEGQNAPANEQTTTKEFSSEDDAENWCSGQEASVSFGGQSLERTCELSEK